MINCNLSKWERAIRLVLAAALVIWVVNSASLDWIDGVALIAAFALLWNSIFGRCYLWKWLGINTRGQHASCNRKIEEKSPQPRA